MDWDDQTVIRKNRPSAKEAKSASTINRAMATGQYEVHKKSTGMHPWTGSSVCL